MEIRSFFAGRADALKGLGLFGCTFPWGRLQLPSGLSHLYIHGGGLSAAGFLTVLAALPKIEVVEVWPGFDNVTEPGEVADSKLIPLGKIRCLSLKSLTSAAADYILPRVTLGPDLELLHVENLR